MLLLKSTINPLNVSSTEFLGIIRTDKLSWNLYIDHICKKARKTIGFFHKSFHSAPINTRCTLYLALTALSLKMPQNTWHLLNKKLINRIESTKKFACRVIPQQWKLSHDEFLQESHLFKIFHGLCSSPNPYRPHIRPCLYCVV